MSTTQTPIQIQTRIQTHILHEPQLLSNDSVSTHCGMFCR